MTNIKKTNKQQGKEQFKDYIDFRYIPRYDPCEPFSSTNYDELNSEDKEDILSNFSIRTLN